MYECKPTNNVSKVNIISNTLIAGGSVLFFIFFFLTMIIIGCYEDEEDIEIIATFSAFALGGLTVIILGIYGKSFIKTFKVYASILSGDPTKSLQNISKTIGKSLPKVKKNVARMIKWGLMSNCFIDDETETVFFTENFRFHYDYEDQMYKLDYVLVQCKGCGALNKVIYGTSKKCDYCGSIVHSSQVNR